MFYSHEILTSRKYGIATIWLVATLGSKSTARRINKKAILGVNIPGACSSVTEPTAPMALRLQSNLLIGISRVYSSQCGYVLSDAESAQQSMRLMAHMVRNSQLDPDAGNARLENLLMPDDPTFVPEEVPDLDLDLSYLERSTDFSSELSSLPSSQLLSQASLSSFGAAGFRLAHYQSSQIDPIPSTLGEDQGRLFEAIFIIDEEGNLIETSPEPDRGFGEAGTASTTTVHGDLDTALPVANIRPSAREQESIGVAMAGAQRREDLPSSSRHEEGQETAQDIALGNLDSAHDAAAAAPSVNVAPIRHVKIRATIIDDPIELRNSLVRDWQTRYVENMRQVRRQKRRKISSAMTKRFAYDCVWGVGLGGLGRRLGVVGMQGPFDEFVGESLQQMILGKELDSPSRGQKRSLSPTVADEERQVRSRSDEVEAGRGMTAVGQNDSDVELGRGPGPVLDDISSLMPWNIPSSATGASRAGSVRARSRTGSIARPSSAGFHGPVFSAGGMHSSSTDPLGRHGSRRLASESPLRGRGRASQATGSDESSLAMPFLPGFSDDSAMHDFELPNPVAEEDDTQGTGHSQWIKDDIRAEDANFLDFVADETAKLGQDSITFEQLLPPSLNDRVVATHGFLHVLTLTTNGLLMAEQDTEFGAPIELTVADLVNV